MISECWWLLRGRWRREREFPVTSQLFKLHTLRAQLSLSLSDQTRLQPWYLTLCLISHSHRNPHSTITALIVTLFAIDSNTSSYFQSALKHNRMFDNGTIIHCTIVTWIMIWCFPIFVQTAWCKNCITSCLLQFLRPRPSVAGMYIHTWMYMEVLIVDCYNTISLLVRMAVRERIYHSCAYKISSKSPLMPDQQF